MKAIFTIGTQDMNDNLFMSLLQTHGVDLVMDVRLKNEGWRYGFAAGPHIRALVEAHGMTYRHEIRLAPTKDMLSRWWKGKDWPSYVDQYAQLMAERDMLKIIGEHIHGFDAPCLLCAEKKPDQCHRRLLAERVSKEFGVPIVHLGRRQVT